MMEAFRHWLLAALLGLALGACGRLGRSDPPAPALPTADIALPSAAAQVVPRAPSPAPTPMTGPPAAQASLATVSPIDPPTSLPITPTLTAILSPDDIAAPLEAELIIEINKVRAANGLPPYHANPDLGAAARAHSCDLAAHQLISHNSSDGRDLAGRLAGSNPPWEWPSESIAAGSADPASVVAWWMDEPPDGWHRKNILDEDQREVGAGYCFAADDSTGNHSYWTADFARHSGQP